MNRKTSAALVLSLVGAFAVAAAAPVQALDLPPQGIGRGGPFRAQCNNGFMVGFTGRVGAWIDHLRPICATWNGTQLVNPAPHPVQAGVSQGGGPSSASCPSFIGQIVLYDTKGNGPTDVMHHIDFQCFSPTGADQGWRQYGSTTKTEGRSTGVLGLGTTYTGKYVSPCPHGLVAVGVHGRSGSFVDAVGLICEPRPAVRVAATPTVNPTPNPSPSLGVVRGANPAIATLRTSTTCKSGFVWRVARPEDLVCVPPDSRARAAQENATAGQRADPARRPNCLPGFVWREAFNGDTVCVTPQIRTLVRDENRLAASRVQ